MTTLLILAALCLQPADDAVVESVDLIELNTFYDEGGRVVFDQIIFRDWNQDFGCYDIVAWRLVKGANQYPQRNWGKGGYTAIWQDGEVLRKVTAHAFVTTFSQYDPELLEREILPKEHRRELKTGPLRVNPAGFMTPRAP